MKTLYQIAKTQIQSFYEIDHELPWLLTFDLMVIAAAIGMGLGTML